MSKWIADLWCRNMHAKAMWPIHGRYICPQCLREHALAWEGPARAAEYADPALRPAAIRISEQAYS